MQLRSYRIKSAEEKFAYLDLAIVNNNKKANQFLDENVDVDQAIRECAFAGDKDQVDYLITKNADMYGAISSYIIGGHFKLADELSKKAIYWNALRSALAYGYAAIGDKAKVEELLRKAADEASSDYIFSGNEDEVDVLNNAVSGYIFSGNQNEADALIVRGAEINHAVICYALIGNEDKVNILITNMGASKKDAFRAYMANGYKDKAEALIKKSDAEDKQLKLTQYRKQKNQSYFRIALVVLAAIFLTPFSLFLTLPRLFRAEEEAKKNNPIQKLVTCKEEYDAVKQKRKELRKLLKGEAKKIKDYDKPPKMLLSEKGKEVVYLVDKAQLTRYKLFSSHIYDKSYFREMYENRFEVKEQIKESKAESKKIMRSLGRNRE